MRESQMKKIIALAVASAFAVPAFAADVTLSGDVEYTITNSDGVTSAGVGDKDFMIVGTGEAGGITATATLDFEASTTATAGTAPDAASTLALAGSFGTVYIGDDVGSAIGSFDEITDKAEAGGGGIDAAGDLTAKVVGIKYAIPTGVDGLAVHLGVETGNATNDEQSTSMALQYDLGVATVFYGTDDADDAEQIAAYGISTTQGPIYLAYEYISNVSGVDGDTHSGVAVSYNYGNGAVTYESNETKGSSVSEQNAISVSYQLGPVNTYIASFNTGDASEDSTRVGVEYAF